MYIEDRGAQSGTGLGWLVPIVLGALSLTVAFAPQPVFREGGPIELASALLLLASFGAFLALAGKADIRRLWYVPLGLLFLAGREFDLDKSLIQPGILKSRMYTGDAPATLKLVAFAILCLILYTAFRAIRHGTGPVIRGLRDHASWAVIFFGGGLLAFLAKTIDGLDRKLAAFDIVVSPEVMMWAGRLEEGMELIFAAALLLSILLWSKARSAAT